MTLTPLAKARQRKRQHVYDRFQRPQPDYSARQERMEMRVLQIAVAAFPEVLAKGAGVDWQAKQQRKDVA